MDAHSESLQSVDRIAGSVHRIQRGRVVFDLPGHDALNSSDAPACYPWTQEGWSDCPVCFVSVSA